MNFWEKLFSEKKMVLGLSPMDGVTDVAMRWMTARYSARNNQSPNSNNQTGGVDLLFTEFVSVDALHFATGEKRERVLKTFKRAQDIAPLQNKPYEIAQVFGHTPELFAEAAELIEKLGFDGIDINMGCPMHKVEDQGSGAGLIRTPALAQEIIKTVQAATTLPVSVKTRIGVADKSEMDEWIQALVEVKPANISLHGRTLRQLYQGQADWETIARAAEIVHKHGGHILGNGDMTSLQQAAYSVQQYGVDGVLIGRGAEGNPGVFLDSSTMVGMTDKEQRLAWMVEHAKIYESIFDNFMPMRKHLAWYCKGFEGAVEMRMKLMQCNSSSDVQTVISTEAERSLDYTRDDEK